MKTFLFLDDWFLDSKVDIVRRFSKAVPVAIPDAHRFSMSSIIWDEEKKHYSALVKMLYYDPKGAPPALYISSDGINWKKTKRNLKFQFINRPRKEVPIPNSFSFEQSWFYDKWDSNSDRRYKVLLWPYPKGLDENKPGLIGCSANGIRWSLNPKHKWYPNASDTNNNIFYNPFSKKWSVICRKHNLDRRVAMTESADLENWTEPRIILQPDVLDSPFLQFYGMAATLYEDEYFIGIVQCFNVPMEEINPWSKGRVKMQGSVDVQLTYSYDGECWLRSDRSNIIQRTELGTYGGTCIYSTAIVDSPDKKKIYIYSIGTLRDHCKGGKPPKGYPVSNKLMLHTLRHDGFACLEPIGGWGQFITKTLIPKSGKLTVNYHAPVGQVLVQVTNSKRKPLPGYSFSDCIPLTGDKIHGNVRWKRHKNLSNLVGKPIRIEFRLFDARIYALRLDCNLWYGYWPEAKIERI